MIKPIIFTIFLLIALSNFGHATIITVETSQVNGLQASLNAVSGTGGGITTVNADMRYAPVTSSIYVTSNFSGTVTASAFVGNGSGLISLNASNIVSGIVPTANLPRLVLDIASNGASINMTGTTNNETTLYSVTVNANTLGANGTLRIVAMFSYTNNSNNKTLKITYGGTAFYTQVLTTTTMVQIMTVIHNRNLTNSQISMPLAYTGLGTNTGAKVTGAVDTTQDQSLVITGTTAVSSDTITLESVTVEVLK